MSDINELYRELIIDHSRRPRNFGQHPTANHIKEGFNPLCGDRLTVYLFVENNRICDLKFEGTGCAISIASASLMTELLKGKTIEEADKLFHTLHQLVTTGAVVEAKHHHELKKLKVLAGVCQFPARVKCATLAWHTVKAAMHDHPETVSTE